MGPETLPEPYLLGQHAVHLLARRSSCTRNKDEPDSRMYESSRRQALYQRLHDRAGHRVSPADAIHLACAASAGIDLFLTNDHRLLPLIIPGIHFIANMDVNLF